MKRSSILAVVVVAGCASGGSNAGDDTAGDDTSACMTGCDDDGDGVVDGDACPDTPAGATVNDEGCAESQVHPTRENDFPPLGLTWTPDGDLGRAGGLTWTYQGIDRADLFHIYWVFCDESMPCGISLDGPLDAPSETWVFSAPASDLAAGKLVFTNTTQIDTETMSTLGLSGRLTMTITDGADAPLPFANVDTLGVNTQTAFYGAEIPGTGFELHAIAEVTDGGAFTPYLDYFDAATTSDTTPGGTAASFGGTFYDE